MRVGIYGGWIAMFDSWVECDGEKQGRVMAARQCGDRASGKSYCSRSKRRGVETSGERLKSTPVSVHIHDCSAVDRSVPAYLLSRPAAQRRMRTTRACRARHLTFRVSKRPATVDDEANGPGTVDSDAANDGQRHCERSSWPARSRWSWRAESVERGAWS